jgi:hypothetical protein
MTDIEFHYIKQAAMRLLEETDETNIRVRFVEYNYRDMSSYVNFPLMFVKTITIRNIKNDNPIVLYRHHDPHVVGNQEATQTVYVNSKATDLTPGQEVYEVVKLDRFVDVIGNEYYPPVIRVGTDYTLTGFIFERIKNPYTNNVVRPLV